MVEIRKQGRANRIAILRSMFDRSGYGLEIGPSFRPVAPKSGGYNVKIVDHATADDLRTKYAGKSPQAVNSIEEVDYVWRGGSLVDLLEPGASFDFIIASHVIEHTTDVVRFLRDCQALLKPGGRVVLAVPDKRFCFDFFRPVSTAGEAIQAYMDKRDRHSVATLFDHNSLLVRNGNIGAWTKVTPPSEVRLIFSPTRGMQSLEAALSSTDYVDAHAWQFTPSSFRLMLSDLRSVGLLNLHERDIVDGTSCEFFVRLQMEAGEDQIDRLELAKNMLIEQAEHLQSLRQSGGLRLTRGRWYQKLRNVFGAG